MNFVREVPAVSESLITEEFVNGLPFEKLEYLHKVLHGSTEGKEVYHIFPIEPCSISFI